MICAVFSVSGEDGNKKKLQTDDVKGDECPKSFWQNLLKLSFNCYYDFILVFMEKSIPFFVARARGIFE